MHKNRQLPSGIFILKKIDNKKTLVIISRQSTVTPSKS